MSDLRRQPAPTPSVGGSARTDSECMMTHTQATDVHGRSVAEIEVSYDHTTLWINSPVGCLARFSHKGFEIASKRGMPLAHRAGFLSSNDWPDFRALVRHHLGLDLPTRPLVT